MNKKLIFLLISLVASGSTFAATAKLSPFQDNLRIQFKTTTFPADRVFTLSYAGSNGVEITGPESVGTNIFADLTIYSDNKIESGFPSVTLHYPTKLFGTQSCTLALADGPYMPRLSYKAIAPQCLGITVGNIVYTPNVGYNDYTIMISDTEQ
ncbi:MAG: hypothetical protein NTZ67_00185 [Gammaproteobacteria bacterium]|nr:hypothetical protein [Gammaproteobacteria bacterium]